MKKNSTIKLFSFIAIVCSVIIIGYFLIPNFLQWLIDKDNRPLTVDEEEKVTNLIDNFYSNYYKLDYSKLCNFFCEKKVNINITDGCNLLTDYENNYFGFIQSERDFDYIFAAYNLYLGSYKQNQIESKEFVKQPYDYPVGNVYYINVNVQYEKGLTRQHFFILNNYNQFRIYELKIEILSKYVW